MSLEAPTLTLPASVVDELVAQIRAMRGEIEELKSHVLLRSEFSPASTKKLLTAAAAAKKLGVDPKTLRKAIDDGLIRTVKLQKRSMVPTTELERFSKPVDTSPAPRIRREHKSTYSVEQELARLDELLGKGKKK